jgi:hypothetical protein
MRVAACSIAEFCRMHPEDFDSRQDNRVGVARHHIAGVGLDGFIGRCDVAD